MMTFYNKNESREIDSLPPSIPWGNGVKRNIPAAPITDEEYRQAGFVEVHPDPEHRPIPDGMEIAPDGRSLIEREDGDMQELLLLITHAEGQAIRDAEAKQARIAGYRQTTEYTAPLLPDHPPEDEVPETGMFFRLEVDGKTTLWFVRQDDLIATLLSSHDAHGHRVMMDVDLRTREFTEVDITAWVGELAPGLQNKIIRRGNVGRRP